VNALAQSAALLAALIYIAVFPTEAFLIDRPWAKRFLRIAPDNVADIRLWAFCTGFRNLFLGLGVIVGLIMLRTGDSVAGQAIVLAFCAFMVLDGITLAVAGLRGYMPHRLDGLRGGFASSGPPLVALVAAAL
jgi:putative membrane protein